MKRICLPISKFINFDSIWCSHRIDRHSCASVFLQPLLRVVTIDIHYFSEMTRSIFQQNPELKHILICLYVYIPYYICICKRISVGNAINLHFAILLAFQMTCFRYYPPVENNPSLSKRYFFDMLTIFTIYKQYQTIRKIRQYLI